MMQSNPYLMLIGALDFSVADLYLNRRGELSDAQRTRLRQQRYKQIEFWLAGLAVLITAGIALEAQWVVVVFGACSIVSMMLAIWLRAEDDLRGSVQNTTGKIVVIPRRLRPSRYDLWVGGEHFTVSRSLKDALDARHSYRVYFTAGSRTIVSAEMAG